MLVDTLLTSFDLYTTHPFEKTRSYKISPNRHLNKTKVGTFVEEGSSVACPNYLQNTVQVFKRNSPNIIDKLRQDQVHVVTSYSYPSHHIICSGGKANGDVYVWKKKIEQSRTESPLKGNTFQTIINFIAIVSFFWMTSGYWAIPITNALDVLASVARTTLVEPNHIYQEQLSAFPDMQPNLSTEFRADNQQVTTTIPEPVTTTSTYTTIIFQTVSVLPGTTSLANAAPQPHAHLGASSQEPQVLASETNLISYPEASHLFDTFATFLLTQHYPWFNRLRGPGTNLSIAQLTGQLLAGHKASSALSALSQRGRWQRDDGALMARWLFTSSRCWIFASAAIFVGKERMDIYKLFILAYTDAINQELSNRDYLDQREVYRDRQILPQRKDQ
ncbi:hypothetical protein BKA70DRAFT_1228106 [Coprinopsis sp. MPI-PUGE-AT-0042]|nr:hypothetical protein BKA70DRAFT_1228106 [Coprinopsis sp. MPI-PUGE-AT-0042]